MKACSRAVVLRYFNCSSVFHTSHKLLLCEVDESVMVVVFPVCAVTSGIFKLVKENLAN